MQQKLFVSLAMLAVLNVSCAEQASKPQVATQPPIKLQNITGLKTPESVVQAKDGKIYVSEINGFGQDGDGQISVIEQGQLRIFATGLDDPKGLVIIGNQLYVADKTKILKIALNQADSQSVSVQTLVPATAFPVTPQFLNDLEVDPQGNLYVSDSGDILGSGKGGAIYKINAQGQVTLLIDGKQDARVMAPNGLLADDTDKGLIYVDFTSGVLYHLNMKTHALTEIAKGLGGGDGVVRRANGMMYVSDWKAGKVFSVSTKGEVVLLKEGYQSAADIAITTAITKDEQYLMVPDMKAGVLDFIPLN